MSVKEVSQALGDWSVELKASTPQSIIDDIRSEFFGHICIVPGRVDVRQYGDALLSPSVARYAGVYRGVDRRSKNSRTLSGAGMALWLGDEDNKGRIFESPLVIDTSTFADAITAAVPSGGNVQLGTVYAGVAGTITVTFQWKSQREVIDYICQTMSTESFPVEWRMNSDGTLDAGRVQDLYVTTPQALIMAKFAADEIGMKALIGEAALGSDVYDYTTRTVLLAEGDGGSVYTGSADLAGVPYVDLFGNTIFRTRLISESDTSSENADARAQLQLNRFSSTRNAVSLSTKNYDIKGALKVGDYVYVYDPASGFYDTNNETVFEGVPIHPISLRCVEIDWPIEFGWTVAFRKGDGTWVDLSDYYVPEGGDSTVVVGDFSKSLTDIGSQPIGTRPSSDTSTPATPVFGNYSTAAYQSSVTSDTKASVQLTWTTPLNVDSSTVIDGDHYEIRIRRTGTFGYPITWNEAEAYTWDALASGTWDRPLSNPVADATDWATYYVEWGLESILINELVCAAEYQVQIRAVDNASPPNFSAWSATADITTGSDVIGPQTPAAPEVHSSRIGIQVIHNLGVAGGGTFNLDADLHHLEVHLGGSESFNADATTLIGKILANYGMLTGQIPVVQDFKVEQVDEIYIKVVAVDTTGNKSDASDASTATPDLIDDAHISSLVVDKLLAGTIMTDWLIAASISTAPSGARAVMGYDGFHTYNSLGIETFHADSTGDVALTGTFRTGPTTGQRIEITATDPYSTIYFYGNTGADYAYINAVDFINTLGDTSVGIGVNTSPYVGSDNTTLLKHVLYMGRKESPVDSVLSVLRNADQVAVGGLLGVSESHAQTAWYDPDGHKIRMCSIDEFGAKIQNYDTSGGNYGGEFDSTNDWASMTRYDSSNNVVGSLLLSDRNRIRGRWPDFETPPFTDYALFTGHVGSATATTSFSIAYGITWPSNFYPICQLQDNAATPPAQEMSAWTSTSFTITLSGSTTGGSQLFFWGFRG